MSDTSKIGVRGFITICEYQDGALDFDAICAGIRNGNGHPGVVLQKNNLIVDQGLSAMAVLLGGARGYPTGAGTALTAATVGGVTVTTQADVTPIIMELGTANTPTTLNNSDTNGVVTLSYRPNVYVLYPTATSVSYVGLIPPATLAASVFTEEALRIGNSTNLLFAKTNFSITKPATVTVGYAFAHTFSFSRV